jgi:hypothetical protein
MTMPFFPVTAEDDLDKAANLVAFNGASILFGLLRGQVGQVTAFARRSQEAGGTETVKEARGLIPRASGGRDGRRYHRDHAQQVRGDGRL